MLVLGEGGCRGERVLLVFCFSLSLKTRHSSHIRWGGMRHLLVLWSLSVHVELEQFLFTVTSGMQHQGRAVPHATLPLLRARHTTKSHPWSPAWGLVFYRSPLILRAPQQGLYFHLHFTPGKLDSKMYLDVTFHHYTAMKWEICGFESCSPWVQKGSLS